MRPREDQAFACRGGARARVVTTVVGISAGGLREGRREFPALARMTSATAGSMPPSTPKAVQALQVPGSGRSDGS